MHSEHSENKKLAGIGWFLLSCLSFALMASIVKLTANEGASSFTMIFMRNVIAVLLLWPIAKFIRPVKPVIINKKLFFLRCFVGFIGMLLMFYSVSLLKVNNFVALSFTIPIFASIGAVFILGEKMGWHRRLAILVGFVGMLIAAQPNGEILGFGLYVCLGFCILTAGTLLMVKKLSANEDNFSMIYFLHLWMGLMSMPLIFFTYSEINSEVIYYCVGIALTSIIAHFGLTRAYSYVPITVLTPFEFSRIIMASIFAYLLLGEIPSDESYIGAAIIIASTTYIVHREAVKKRK